VAAQRLRQAVQPVAGRPTPPVSETELSQEHGTHGWWGETAIAWLGGAGVASDVAKYSSGTATVGFNLNNLAKSRIYSNGWHGNQYVWAERIASGAERMGFAAVAGSTAVDVLGWKAGKVSTSKLLTDLGVSAVGLAGGLPGSVFAGQYYAFDTFYPGGAYSAAKDYANFLNDHPEIPGWGLFPP
jgi:hypothetical protein